MNFRFFFHTRSRIVSRSTGHGNWIASPSVLVPDSMNIRSGDGFYNSISERINGEIGSSTRRGPFQTCNNSTFTDQCRKLKQEFLDTESHQPMYNGNSIQGQTSSTTKQPSFAAQFSKRGGDTNESISLETKWSFNEEKSNKAKRKADDLDLSLSLSTRSKEKEVRRSLSWDEEDEGSNLSLSLSSTSTKESDSIYLSMPSKYPELASTLDLTMWIWEFKVRSCWYLYKRTGANYRLLLCTAISGIVNFPCIYAIHFQNTDAISYI